MMRHIQRPRPTHAALAVLAALGLGACDGLLVEPAPPPAMAVTFALSSSLAETTTADLYDQANRLFLRVVEVETESVLFEEVRSFSPSSDETRVRISVAITEDETPIRYLVELRDGTTPLLRGAGSMTLVKGETSPVEVTLHSGDRRTITFDELQPQPVHGLSFAGVNFRFEVGGQPSDDAVFNAGGPGGTTHIQDPSLEGTTDGILTLAFDVPTPVLEFGVALSFTDILTPGFTVELLGPNGELIDRRDVTTEPLVSFTEAFFSHVGTPVSTAIIDFRPPFTTRFALDNLTYGGSFGQETAQAGLRSTRVDPTSTGHWPR